MNDATGNEKNCKTCGHAIDDEINDCPFPAKIVFECRYSKDKLLWKPQQPQTPQPCCEAAVKAEAEVKRLRSDLKKALDGDWLELIDKYQKMATEAVIKNSELKAKIFELETVVNAAKEWAASNELCDGDKFDRFIDALAAMEEPANA